MSELDAQQFRIRRNRRRGYPLMIVGVFTIPYFVACQAHRLVDGRFLAEPIERIFSLPVLSFYWAHSSAFEITSTKGYFLLALCFGPFLVGSFFLGIANREAREIREIVAQKRRKRLEDEL